MDAAKASNPVGSKVDRRMNPARVIFIDTRHNLSFRSLRPYRFVSITRRTLADPRRSLRPVSVSRYTFLLPLSTFGEQLNRILRQITPPLFFLLDFFHTNSPAVIVVDRHTRFQRGAGCAVGSIVR